jgi:hypothetical protein
VCVCLCGNNKRELSARALDFGVNQMAKQVMHFDTQTLALIYIIFYTLNKCVLNSAARCYSGGRFAASAVCLLCVARNKDNISSHFQITFGALMVQIVYLDFCLSSDFKFQK